MAWKLNPETGRLDYYETGGGGASIFFYKDIKIVDAPFLITPNITLSGTPLINSETVLLNGLAIDNSNYSIVGNTLTMVVDQLKIGDILYINFAS